MSKTTTQKLKIHKTLSLVLILVILGLTVALVPHVLRKKQNVKKGYIALSEHQELSEEFGIASELLNMDQELLAESYSNELVSRLEDLEAKASTNQLRGAIKRRIKDVKARIKTKNKNEMSLLEIQTELSSKIGVVDSLIALSDSLGYTLKNYEKLSKRKTDSLILAANKKEAQLQRKETVKVISFKNNNGNLIHYLGETQNKAANGNGVGIWSTGSIYRGEWSNNLRHGTGEFSWSDGQQYKGDFVQDIRTGNGTYYWPSGEKYEGEFVNNKRHGNGVFYDPDGNVKFDGEWKNDKYVGS